MQYLKGISFPAQLLTSKEWGALFENVISDGILRGCNVTYSGANVTVSPGILCIKGRLIAIPSSITEATSPTDTNGYGRLKVCINMSNESTKAVNHMAYITPEYSSTSTFPALTQNDINDSGALYEVELATFAYTSGSISSLTRTLVESNSKQKQITYGTTDPSGGQIGDIYIKYTV